MERKISTITGSLILLAITIILGLFFSFLDKELGEIQNDASFETSTSRN